MTDWVLIDNEVQIDKTTHGNKALYYLIPSGHPYTEGWEGIDETQEVQEYKFQRNSTINQDDNKEIVAHSWDEVKNTLTQEILLDNEEDRINRIICRIKRSFFIPNYEALTNRILTLLQEAKEEEPISTGISAGSLQNFYDFMRIHTSLKYPAISLTPDYNIYSSWRGDQNRLLSAHFLPNGEVRFVIFKPNDMHPGKQIRISGKATTDALMEIAEQNGVAEWITE